MRTAERPAGVPPLAAQSAQARSVPHLQSGPHWHALAGVVVRAAAAFTTPQALAALEALKQCYREGPGGDALIRLGREIVSAFPDAESPQLPDPRVMRMIGFAAENLEETITLPAAASHINLSESRARHLFAAQTGLPFKTYVLWLRIARATQLYGGGHSLTEAAHQAGFADSAHFSRTFRRTFGLPAAALRLES